MPDNKNQHFVPQFYLRNFAADPERRSINLFNLRRGQPVAQASIRNQCSRDYWHPNHDPVFEEGIKSLEGYSAAAIKATILTDSIQKLSTLNLFLIIQLGRTVHQAEAFAESCSKMHMITYGRPPSERNIDPIPTIAMYLMNSPIIMDMSACLVVNRTNIDFITSDNPVVLCNWWFHHIYRRRPNSGIGLAQAGLEVFLPLSPRHVLALYDRNIWSVSKANAVGTIYLKSEGDVVALNERQILNAQHNVYFASMEMANSVTELWRECATRRKVDKMRVTEWVQSSTHPQKFVRPGSPEAALKVRERLISTEANEIEPVRRVTLFSKRFKPRYDEPAILIVT